MSRRDTIIIAVLINAGLLVVLLSTALKSSKSEEVAAAPVVEQQQPVAQTTEIPIQREVTVANAPRDEVDQLLRQFSQPAVTETAQALPLAEPKNDFAQD